MPETPLFQTLSVIIPTYNRKKVLARALEGYLAQSSPSWSMSYWWWTMGRPITGIDGTRVRRRSPFTIRYLRQLTKDRRRHAI